MNIFLLSMSSIIQSILLDIFFGVKTNPYLVHIKATPMVIFKLSSVMVVYKNLWDGQRLVVMERQFDFYNQSHEVTNHIFNSKLGTTMVPPYICYFDLLLYIMVVHSQFSSIFFFLL